MTVYLCPTDKKYHCSWEGHAENILDHFEKEHDDLIHYSETFDIDLETPTENRLFLIDGEIYLIQVFLKETILILKLRYLGLEKFASRICYNINIRANDKYCQIEEIIVTPEGFLEVNLARLRNVHTDVHFVTCILHITKEFSDEDSLDNIFNEEKAAVPNERDFDENNQNTEYVNIQENTEEQAIHTLDDDNEKVFVDRKEELINSGEEENEIPKKVSGEEMVEAINEEIDTEPVQVVREEIQYNSIRHDFPEVSNLSRSKSTAFEDMRKKWSRAKSTLSLGSIQEIDNTVTCTNCGNCLKIPIYVCPTGHHFCEKCQLGICRICEQKITYVRDAGLEKAINKYSLSPCQFQRFGCPEKLLHNDLHQHEVNCLFCIYKCPIAECHFEGQFKGLCKHLKLIHSSTKLLSSFILSFNNYPAAFLANEEKGIFHCYVTCGPEDITWTAKFCGPKERNFFCELKFKNGKVKEPVLLKKNENEYAVKINLNDLKRMKLKAKNAVLTITS